MTGGTPTPLPALTLTPLLASLRPPRPTDCLVLMHGLQSRVVVIQADVITCVKSVEYSQGPLSHRDPQPILRPVSGSHSPEQQTDLLRTRVERTKHHLRLKHPIEHYLPSASISDPRFAYSREMTQDFA